MTSDILIQSGDLIEFTHPQENIRVRGIVRGFEIRQNRHDGENKLSIWVFQGRDDINHVYSKKDNSKDSININSSNFKQGEKHFDKELVCWSWEGLKKWDLEVVKKGNSPRERTNFMIE